MSNDDELLPLVRSMAAGDASVVPAFVERVGPRVHAAALRITRSTVAAGVLTEQVLSECWRTAPFYDRHMGPPLTWILAVTRAHGQEWLERRRGKAGRLKTRPDAGEVLTDGEAGADAEVLAALARVGDEDARVLRRVWYGDPPGSDELPPSAELLRRAVTALAVELGYLPEGG